MSTGKQIAKLLKQLKKPEVKRHVESLIGEEAYSKLTETPYAEFCLEPSKDADLGKDDESQRVCTPNADIVHKSVTANGSAQQVVKQVKK